MAAGLTETEWKRLRELDQIIAWNNPEDGGRPLTEEEAAEHTQLFWRSLQEWEADHGGHLIEEE